MRFRITFEPAAFDLRTTRYVRVKSQGRVLAELEVRPLHEQQGLEVDIPLTSANDRALIEVDTL